MKRFSLSDAEALEASAGVFAIGSNAGKIPNSRPNTEIIWDLIEKKVNY
jgi:hypothetical protein